MGSTPLQKFLAGRERTQEELAVGGSPLFNALRRRGFFFGSFEHRAGRAIVPVRFQTHSIPGLE